MPDAASSGPLLGAELELTVGAVAHGGFCVARVGDDPRGRVVFVRHALPGERVRVLVTEDAGGGFSRADAIEIHQPAADRVDAPCPHAGPGHCGGCDWQHATGAAQRRLKADVVQEQLRRIAGLDIAVEVEELAGGLLGWRTRTVYAVGSDGTLGLHRHRSHQVERIEACPLGAPGVGDADVLGQRFSGPTGIEVARSDDGAITVLTHRPGPGRQARGRRAPDRVEILRGRPTLRHRIEGRDFDVDARGFWQVHPQAAATFTAAMLAVLQPRPGETALDLYCGAGLLTAALAEAVGQTGRVVGIESAPSAVADARHNLADLPWARVDVGKVSARTLTGLGFPADIVVLDPPRAGAGAEVMTAVLGGGARAVCYVACDPASLARDVRTATELGWQLSGLRAFDAFPMTHHVECVALLEPAPETHVRDTAAGEAQTA